MGKMRFDGYVRVSEVRDRAGENFLSPSLQREQIERWARNHDVTLATIFEELNQSGANADRPMLTELLQRVTDRRVDGVVVASFDRFGRSLLDSLAAIQRIHDAGASFVSLRERLDLTTDTGKLVLRIMLSMAEWELDRARTRWNAARQRAVARGVCMGPAPTGYGKDPAGRLAPDGHAGPVITELFLRRADGATIHDLCKFLEQERVPTAAGNSSWKPAALHKLIHNRVYLGELHHGSMSNARAHNPLTDPVTWSAAQKPRVREYNRGRRLPTLLDGVLRCTGCGMLMRSNTVTTRGGLRKRIYYCGRRFSAGECQSPAWISAAVAEPYIDAVFFTLLHAHKAPSHQRMPARRLALAHERAAQELTIYRDSPAIRASIDHKRFTDGLAKRYARERVTTLSIAAERSQATTQIPPAKELESSWPALDLEQRRALMCELIDCAFVARREAGQARIFVCARGDAPVDLCQRGNRRPSLQPFHPEGIPQVQPALRTTTWRKKRIATELADFLALWNEDRWPSDEEFVFAGRGPLLRQINQTGGPVRWGGAALRPRRRSEWTDARIRAALDVILAGRTHWPTSAEFKALGLSGLYSVLERRGRRKWAEDYGLQYRKTGGAGERWTEASVREALTRLCAGRDTYPSDRDFAAAGLGGLYTTMARRYGGHDRWAGIMGLPRRSWSGPQARSQRPSRGSRGGGSSRRDRCVVMRGEPCVTPARDPGGQ